MPKKLPIWLRFVAPLIVAMCQQPIDAAVVTITSNKDTTIFQNNTSNSAGAQAQLYSGTNTAISPRRGLIAFDVAGNVPAGSTILGVKLTMTMTMVAGSGMGGGGGSPTIELFPLTKNWGEGVVSAGSGQGSAANAGDATWNAAQFGSVSWTTAGGDFSGAASASLQVVGTTVPANYDWLSTAALISDVQSWLDSPAGNFGWMIKNTDESNAQTFRAFGTREAAVGSRPQLEITYVPEPAGLALVGGFGITLLLRRKGNRVA